GGARRLPRETEERPHGPHIRLHFGPNVLADPAVLSFRAGGGSAGGSHTAVGGGLDAGSTGGGQFHPARSGGAAGLVRAADRHSLPANLPAGRMGLRQVPDLPSNSHGPTLPPPAR